MRIQCKKCPWRKDVDPNEIPNGYSRDLHCGLADTIAEPGAMPHSVKVRWTLRIMACHESKVGKEIPCIGWLANQLGDGNNIPLRIAAMRDISLTDFELVGEQHKRFEDTIPRPPTDAAWNEARVQRGMKAIQIGNPK